MQVDGEMATLREAVAEGGPASLEWARLGLVRTSSKCFSCLPIIFGLFQVRGAAEVASAAFSPTTGVWESLQATLFVSKLHLLRFFLY